VSSSFAQPPGTLLRPPIPDARLHSESGGCAKEWFIAAALFCATFVCSSFAGLFYSIGDIGFLAYLRIFFHKPSMILHGLTFSIPLMSILLAHELGHYFACRYYGMQCTPPFFIPVPISITGTLGAFIRIKSPFRHKRALFDIGVAGPLAGFALVFPFLCIGIGLSQLIPRGAYPPGGWSFGEPLIFRFVGTLVLGYDPGRQDMIAHPIAMAAWIGLLVTSLNLLPVWQLDGGHIAYALFGRTRQRQLSIAGIVFLLLLSLRDWRTPSYLLFALLLLIMGWRVRFYHPRTLFDEEKVDSGRILVGILALVIFLVSFIPVPISFG